MNNIWMQLSKAQKYVDEELIVLKEKTFSSLEEISQVIKEIKTKLLGESFIFLAFNGLLAINGRLGQTFYLNWSIPYKFSNDLYKIEDIKVVMK